jgi:hypothetical protein
MTAGRLRILGALLVSGLTLVATVAGADGDGLWREDDPHEGRSTEAYRQKLRGVLLGDERAPLCQLMTIPSFRPERAVGLSRRCRWK